MRAGSILACVSTRRIGCAGLPRGRWQLQARARHRRVQRAGLGGQFIVVHAGLDLVITAHNATNPVFLWDDVRPAVVAKDPMFQGDMTAFCAAYASGSYAPDLLAPRIAPTK
jgi:hypothetical protein